MCFLNFHHFSETKAAVTDPDIEGIQYIDENVDEENNTIDRDEDSTSDVVDDGEKDGEDDPSALHINKVNLSRVLKENERARLRVCVEITHPALKLPVYRTWTGEHLSPSPVEVTSVRPENHLSSTCCYPYRKRLIRSHGVGESFSHVLLFFSSRAQWGEFIHCMKVLHQSISFIMYLIFIPSGNMNYYWHSLWCDNAFIYILSLFLLWHPFIFSFLLIFTNINIFFYK